jgi:4-hydroxybutyrate CoA-transferase
MPSWQEEYQRKLTSAEEAAGLVKSGDLVAFTAGREAHAVGLAIAARLGDLTGVKVLAPSPGYDFGWYDPGWDAAFEITISWPTATAQDMLDERRCDINLPLIIPFGADNVPPNVLLTEVSMPDERGFCSFGASLWTKRQEIEAVRQQGGTVIAEVNDRLIRTYGDNYVHVSEIDYFVEHLSRKGQPGTGSLGGRVVKEPEPYLKDIVTNVASLIRDGDCLQIGVGRTTEPLIRMGLLDGKQDIGFHSEATPPGVISLVREGVINGKRKTLLPERVVVTSIGGGSREDMQWINNNPLFYLVDLLWLEDIRIISQNDNMVAINNALAIDLTGQITAESLGTRLLSVAGGQIPFAFGALVSRGGRSITVLPSTAREGTVSRIMPHLPEGTAITLQRNIADLVVTEYGVAKLRNKTIRQRCEELISIAHPDFRAELKKEARKLYWP